MINVPKNMNVSGTNVSMLHVFGCYAVDIGVRIIFCFKNGSRGSLLEATIHAEWTTRLVLTL